MQSDRHVYYPLFGTRFIVAPLIFRPAISGRFANTRKPCCSSYIDTCSKINYVKGGCGLTSLIIPCKLFTNINLNLLLRYLIICVLSCTNTIHACALVTSIVIVFFPY